MTELFSITITTTSDFGELPSFFTDKGEPVGRTLRGRRNDFDPNNIYYIYDVESSPNMFEQLSSGTAKLYNVTDYTVERSLTHWVRKD